MNLFDIPSAQHYCANYAAGIGPPAGSLRDFFAVQLQGVTTLTEGTPTFGAYRDCALRDAERSLFLAISHYRRSADLLIASASPWAHVTLYYGSYFAACALLGLFGGWIYNRTVVDVVVNHPGNQQLRIVRNVKSKGTHKMFWDLFYGAVTPLHHWVDPGLLLGIQPVAGNPLWQIETRNTLNYDTFAAWQLTGQFQVSFRRSGFPGSLPGALNTQFRVFEALLKITCTFARQFGLATDALAGVNPIGTRRAKARALVFDEELPALARRVRRRGILV